MASGSPRPLPGENGSGPSLPVAAVTWEELAVLLVAPVCLTATLPSLGEGWGILLKTFILLSI